MMTKEGFIEFLRIEAADNSGKATSYARAIDIIEEAFLYNDIFGLQGKSIYLITDIEILNSILSFVINEQHKAQKGFPNFFDKITSQSYVTKNFCSAAIKQFIEYAKCEQELLRADELVKLSRSATEISSNLSAYFQLDKVGVDKEVISQSRRGQNYFRRMVLKNYGNKCCVTGLNIPMLLRASHIIPWAKDAQNRMNPENGLCLSATYDAAFDEHLISFDDDYRMILSPVIKEFYTAQTTRDYFQKYEGTQLLLPQCFLPNKQFLAKHRNELK